MDITASPYIGMGSCWYSGVRQLRAMRLNLVAREAQGETASGRQETVAGCTEVSKGPAAQRLRDD